MTKLFFFISSILFSAGVNCQDTLASVVKNDMADQKPAMITSGEPIFTKVEKEAEFPGGASGWMRHIQKTLNSNIAIQNGAPSGSYRVLIKFVVLNTGKIGDCEALTNFGYGMEKEVIRTIQSSPKWIPAQQNGHLVNEYKYQQVSFYVSLR